MSDDKKKEREHYKHQHEYIEMAKECLEGEKAEKKEVVFNDPCQPCEHLDIACRDCDVYPFKDSEGD